MENQPYQEWEDEVRAIFEGWGLDLEELDDDEMLNLLDLYDKGRTPEGAAEELAR
jgi:hypothetical protein